MNKISNKCARLSTLKEARAVSSALTKRPSECSNPLWIVACKPEMDSSCIYNGGILVFLSK